MRRPLNWIVVAISLLMLFANRMVADPIPAARAPATSEMPGPFAYVQEDGTEIFLAVPASTLLPRSESAVLPPLSFEDVHANSGFDDPADPKTAVYTWTAPLVTAERPDYQ